MKLNNYLYRQPKRGKKDDYIKSLKAKNEELIKALEFAMTLIPEEKLPSGISYQSYRWLINKARENEYVEPHMIGDEND
jgi:spore germination protein YaaH